MDSVQQIYSTYFLTTQGHGGLPRMSDQPNAGATSETAQTWKTIHTKHTPILPTRRIWNDDYGGLMICGDLVGLKFPDICLTGGEKPRKKLTQETCPDRGSNPGPMRDKRACYHLLHSGGLYLLLYHLQIINYHYVLLEFFGNLRTIIFTKSHRPDLTSQSSSQYKGGGRST